MIDKIWEIIDKLSFPIFHNHHIVGEVPPHHWVLGIFGKLCHPLTDEIEKLLGCDCLVAVGIRFPSETMQEIVCEKSIG